MPGRPLPLIVLAGYDPRPPVLPEEGADHHPLVGSKGIDIRIDGRPMIDLLLERVQASGAFDPIYIGGPHAVYGHRRGQATVIHTDGSFGHNIAVTVDAVQHRHRGEAIALTTCDILPEAADLRVALDDWGRHAPLDFWFPLIRVPDDPAELGASAWKPQYRILDDAGEQVSVLPGHLVVVEPHTFRFPLVLRAFDLAYRTRNRSIAYRLVVMVSGVVGSILLNDLRNLFRGRPSLHAVGIPWHGVAIARGLQSGRTTSSEIARHVHRVFVHRDHRRRHPERRGRLAVIDALSLATDIDTEEEAAERQRTDRKRRPRRLRRRRVG